MLPRFLQQLKLARRMPPPVPVWGLRLQPPTLDRYLALLAHRWNLLGGEEKVFLERYVEPAASIVDVGSNQGLYALFAARLAATGSVFALEPDPGLFQALTHNIAVNRITNIQALPYAAGERAETLRFRPGRLNRGDNRVQRTGRKTDLLIQAAPLDELVPLQPVHLLKIDVQGWEVAVLRGASRILQENRDLLILVEFWPHGLRLAGSRPEELLELLREHAFFLFRLKRAGALVPVHPDDLRRVRGRSYLNLVACRQPVRLRAMAA